MRNIKRTLKHLIPARIISGYHFAIAIFGAALYRFPSRQITVIGVTGTKGKSSTVEYINAIFEAAGHRTALTGTIRTKIADMSKPNLMRMSMPGRFFLQRFLRRSVNRGCTVAILEMTSEGAKQHRHRGIDMDALVFTNLSPEHIESHGSLDAYANAKYELGKQLVRSRKRPRVIVANEDDPQGTRYLSLPVEVVLPFSLKRVEPWKTGDRGGMFTIEGASVHVRLPGGFSIQNALAAALCARAFQLPMEAIVKGIESVAEIPGRAQEIKAGQQFSVVVDYAHTPDSLRALYAAYGTRRKICVLGATGGGRDHWKRPIMGEIADSSCDTVILTNEDPYDEEPQTIVEQVASGCKRQPEIIMDRREAIRRAFSIAQSGDAVLITGKGTDPCICGRNGSKMPWSDADVAREELALLGHSAA